MSQLNLDLLFSIQQKYENANNGSGNGGNGGNGNGIEGLVYFYHPDHLGSSSYITDANGEVSQHLE